jgi:predicted exporter
VKTDLLAMLPATSDNDLKQRVFNHVSINSMGRINILFGADDTALSKEAGLYFKSLITQGNVNYEVEQTIDEPFWNTLASYNYNLLSDRYRLLLEKKNYDELTDSALSILYSPVNAAIVPFAKDPFFFLSNYIMESGLLKSGFHPEQSVLVSAYNGKIYSFLSVNLEQGVTFSPKTLSVAMGELEQAKAMTLERFPDILINMTGIPVHTYHVSSSSVKEVGIISAVSLLLVLAAMFLAMPSLYLILATFFPILSAVFVAFMSVNIVFKEAHILTLVFGTSLIGLSVDYCLHYVMERRELKDSYETLKQIKIAVTISLITSIIGFAALTMSGMPLLKQIAFFSITGLLYAYMTVMIIYPLFFKRDILKVSPDKLRNIEKSVADAFVAFSKKYIFIKAILFVVIAGTGILMLKSDDGIQHLYRPSPTLAEAEKLFSDVSKQKLSPAFFFVSGTDDENVLINEEKLRKNLDNAVSKGILTGYKAISQLVPSIQKQKENYILSTEFFGSEITKLAGLTGINDTGITIMNEYIMSGEGKYLTVDDVLKNKHFDILKSLWIEGQGSVVLTEGVNDYAALMNFQDNDIYYMNKISDLSDMLAGYRYKVTFMLLLSYTAILVFMLARYGLRNGAMTAVSPGLAILTVLAVFGFTGVSISFFHVIALFLILCFGIDYSVFHTENANRLKYSAAAVMLSCTTTFLSFGMLAFTSFEVTKSLGLTLFLGIPLVYMFSLLSKAIMGMKL